jgi:hypothetical protein
MRTWASEAKSVSFKSSPRRRPLKLSRRRSASTYPVRRSAKLPGYHLPSAGIVLEVSWCHCRFLPRSMMRRSSSRTTRKHKSDVSPTSARHSLVQSSMIVRMRKWRPLMGWSEMKWRLQRSLGAKGIIIGALVRLRVCRSRRARTASFPHGTAG